MKPVDLILSHTFHMIRMIGGVAIAVEAERPGTTAS